VPVFAFFLLGEQISFITALAIVTILVAIYILHFDGHLTRGFKNLFDAIIHQDLRWAFYTLAMVVAYSLVDKKGMDIFFQSFPERTFMNGATFFFLESAVGFTLCNVYLTAVHPMRDILSVWKKEWKTAFLAGVATLLSYSLICVVLQFEPVSLVVAVRQTSVFMVVYWGCWRLGEPFGRERLLAGTLTGVGVGIMAFAP
jgi:drug/metabolite transporter (DMT)-like permease